MTNMASLVPPSVQTRSVTALIDIAAKNWMVQGDPKMDSRHLALT